VKDETIVLVKADEQVIDAQTSESNLLQKQDSIMTDKANQVRIDDNSKLTVNLQTGESKLLDVPIVVNESIQNDQGQLVGAESEAKDKENPEQLIIEEKRTAEAPVENKIFSIEPLVVEESVMSSTHAECDLNNTTLTESVEATTQSGEESKTSAHSPIDEVDTVAPTLYPAETEVLAKSLLKFRLH
jgi:hypothetical protein